MTTSPLSAPAGLVELQRARPQLHAHVTVHPINYRSERWYVLRNTATMQTLRLNRDAYEILARFDGETSVAEMALAMGQGSSDENTALEEITLVIYQLAASHYLVTEKLPPDFISTLKRRAAQNKTNAWRQQALNVTAVKLRLINPDRLLTSLKPIGRWLISPVNAVIWGIFMVVSVARAIAHLDDIGAALTPGILAPSHLVAMAIVYIAIKLCHELGHGLLTKVWGGEVREAGILLLWLLPVPYVDGSAANIMPDRRKRAAIAAAGVVVELTLAAIALHVWLSVSAGLVQDIAFNVMVIGGFSALLVNGNPLLKFDGYYVLEDLVELPNLATRAQRFYLYLVQRYLFGNIGAVNPASEPGERKWFAIYAPLAFIYRCMVLTGIAVAFAAKYLAAGVAVAALAVVSQFVLPVVKGIRYLAGLNATVPFRQRAYLASAAAGLMVALLLGVAPMPAVTSAEGVVATPQQGTLYTQAAGFVDALLTEPDSWVQAGQPLLKLRNPEFEAEVRKLQARRTELEIARHEALRITAAEAARRADLLTALNAELAAAKARVAGLTVVSPVAGRFIPTDPNVLLNRFLPQGAIAGYVVASDARVVRAVVTQEEIGQIRRGVISAHVRLAQSISTEFTTSKIYEVPGGGTELPSAALGIAGGGRLPIVADDETGRRTPTPVFTVEVPLPAGAAGPTVGQRAYVRFDHSWEPLAFQISRSMQQLLLRRLRV
ncbi:MAG: hypothetical protein H6978_00995 [Gammaproteobacteria bacterium]|nr:hypothetical protein [Gammaproteobacteria bacterium]